MTAAKETFQFQAEARQLLDLMIHSIYSNKDIFLRELISNSSDAIDKRRVEGLKNPALASADEPRILIEVDRKSRLLSIDDNGVGMSREEVIRYIGTIAKSGTKEFLHALKEGRDKPLSAELIGQFGVGFYASFMAADRIELLTRRAGEETATRWASSGDGSYSIEDAERAEVGTTVTLHLKPADEEDGLHDYSDPWQIRTIVKRYSDFVTHPIRLRTLGEEPKEGEERDEAEAPKEQTLNSMKALWTRSKDEVKEEEYREFYKHVSHDWNDPLAWTTLRGEGSSEFHALLYIPSRAPLDLFHPESPHGIHLYVKRVFIMDDCQELLPRWLRFMRGVVDSEDLSLNISREILQQSRQIRLISKRATRKVLDLLEDLKKNQPEKYATFWKEFGRALKEGIFTDAERREKLLDLCRFSTTHSDSEPATLEDYLGRMKEGQKTIYYLTGETRAAIENSPHLEAFREKGVEVLLLDDPVDEVWVQAVEEYKGMKLQSAAKGEIELGGDEEKKAAEALEGKARKHKSLLERLGERLKDDVKEVRLSTRLTKSAACLVGETHDLSPHLVQMLKAANQEIPKAKRILELNPNHPLLAGMQAAFDTNPADPELDNFAELLHGQALLSEGSPLPDAARFGRLVSDLMVKAIG